MGQDNLEEYISYKEDQVKTGIRDILVPPGGSFNIGYYYDLLDILYYQWKSSPSTFKEQGGREKYEDIWNKVIAIKEPTETRRKKISKLVDSLKENGVLKVCHKTTTIKVSLGNLQKNLSLENKKFFWLKLKGDFVYFQHLLFYRLVLQGR